VQCEQQGSGFYPFTRLDVNACDESARRRSDRQRFMQIDDRVSFSERYAQASLVSGELRANHAQIVRQNL
jgi:hypothetical protein